MLETLVLADNWLSEVSEQIAALKRLRMLDLGHNDCEVKRTCNLTQLHGICSRVIDISSLLPLLLNVKAISAA